MFSVNILEFSTLIWLGSLATGFFGALTGLGGGALLVPFLTLAFKVDIRYAIGASFISVIATSSGAAAAYVKEGFTNMRVGMFLEIATTLGALLGAFLAARVPTSAIAIIVTLSVLAALLYSLSCTLVQPYRWGICEGDRDSATPSVMHEHQVGSGLCFVRS
jgi:uncharacterized membrane protein YfcA